MIILMLTMMMMLLLRQYGDDGELIAMKKSVLIFCLECNIFFYHCTLHCHS